MSPSTPAEARREQIVELLRAADGPVTGSDLSTTLGVSRQVIVNDVAIVRATGVPIIGSPRGYVLMEAPDDRPIATIASRHDRDGNRREFEILVDRGIEVIDVVVEHAIYGEVSASLWIRSRADVDRYVEAMDREDAKPLWTLTGGVHLHHVRAPNPDALAAAKRELAEADILLDED